MDAKEALHWMEHDTGIMSRNDDAWPIAIRALRLLAAAEGGDGTPETDEFAEHDFVLEAIECHPMILERIKAWADFARLLERERNGLAARVRELEADIVKAERRAERLKFHAEAMCLELRGLCDYPNAEAEAYRAEFKGE